ncbi:MarR family transcriptional regulator [Haloarcula taiwanensis]|uniref:MarR family transcriptional regulator n=1 Tax=Haloarcula taiwanensis TaxID=1932004 RepID=A0A2H5A1F2_9EURY|nr:MarR family transcriptional regulator [Haloarcula taiwanensis]AUG48545.1 MarR family transcriptional regulator [Haloarcula taiwanensis]
MRTIGLAPHELHANLLFNSDGLAPFFALDSEVKAGEGSKSGEFLQDGERWVVRLSYQDSNIVHPGERTPQGTDWQLQTMREYRLKVARHPEEDSVGQQDFVAHVAPRWPGMQGERDDGSRIEIPVPDGFGEGVNVRVKGSNIEFHRYPELLQRAAIEIGVTGRYFEEPHPYSNVQDAEKYARVHRDASGPVHARDGPIAAMGHLLESDRRGYRKIVQNDDDERGRNLLGYYHTATLGPKRIREAFPDHHLPKEVKHYYAREALSVPDDHPLSHPKVGSSLQASLLDDDETVRWRDLETLERELDQTVLSVLADAGIDIAPSGSGPFVEDSYFEPEVDHSGPEPVGLDLTRVEQKQESVVVRHLSDGLSPVQWEALEMLVADGGQVAPADIADEYSRHVESVRRALREMEDLVISDYADVSLRSEYVAEMVHAAVDEAREATRRAVDTAAKAAEAAERGLENTMSAFIAWAARHGIDVKDAREAQMTLRFGEIEKHGKAIREGFRVWKDAGMPEERYRQAQVQLADGSRGTAWRWLATG